MTWREAVLRALRRLAEETGSPLITRRVLIQKELRRIVRDTGSRGKTPEQTLSRVLQELRDDGTVLFHDGQGTYLLVEDALDIEAVPIEELPDEVLDQAFTHNKLRMGRVEVASTRAEQRLRLGQERLRVLTLENYGHRCGLCDVAEDRLLVASHIARWADNPEGRGDLRNLLCLCRFHDPLFEEGYFTLDDDLRVRVLYSGPSRAIRTVLELAGSLRRPLRFYPDPIYLEQHRRRVGLAP